MSRHRKSYLKGVIYGSLIGAGLALIYSPRNGEQSQALLRDIAEETRKRAGDFTQNITDQTTDWGKLGTEVYSEGRVLIERFVDNIMESMRSSKLD
jgi:gas vesicle protein